jgi:hypothetical protein
MVINLNNIEELIFFDKKAQALFPEFRHLFDQWQLGQRIPGMKTLGQRSILELLQLFDQNDIIKLEDYFGDKIMLERLDHHIVANYSWSLEDQNELCQFVGYRDFCISRNKDNASITFWR